MGLLAVLLGLIAFLIIPLEMVEESSESFAFWMGIGSVGTGLTMFVAGGAAWLGSLFLEQRTRR